jgi:hypothetical protein
MRRIVVVALLAAACGGSGSDAPACTAGAERCHNFDKERCWDDGTGLGWHPFHQCQAMVTTADGSYTTLAAVPCVECVDGYLYCASPNDTRVCASDGGIKPH